MVCHLKKKATLLMVLNISSAFYALLRNYLKKLAKLAVSSTRYCRGMRFMLVLNTLIAMIHDSEQCARELGWRRIFTARMSPSHSVRQQIFKTSKLRFNSKRYFEMIDWQNTAVTEPPVMLCVDSSKPIIEEHIKTKMPPQQLFPNFHCHTQAVERAVKLVTEASTHVVNPIERDGYTKTILTSRKKFHGLSQNKT